ncbi:MULTISPECIES: Imm65 family immunity protein [Bacteroidaceae]|nr:MULTISPECIES: Imm65 family immunity protein [Bacteroidaceae]
MGRILFSSIFLLVMVGCTQPTLNKVQQTVKREASLLVDSGLIVNKYVLLYETAINDSNHIYKIQASDCPAYALDYPAKIVPYKDRYFCFIELDEVPMSADEMIEQSEYSGNLYQESGLGENWLFVVSKDGEKKKLTELSLLEPGWETDFNIKELWPYFSGYVKEETVQMGIISHDIKLDADRSLHCNIDSVKQKLFWNEVTNQTMIKEVYGEMYLKNNTDSIVSVSSESMKHYAIVNNQDSLYLSLFDSLPITLAPDEYKIINYKSLPHQEHFFKHIALEKDCWGYLYKLFCNSAYCLMNVAGKNVQQKIMFCDIGNYGFKASNSNNIYFQILNQGIYDKKETHMLNFKFWDDKWKATDEAERIRIWDEAEKNVELYVERIYRRKEKIKSGL